MYLFIILYCPSYNFKINDFFLKIHLLKVNLVKFPFAWIVFILPCVLIIATHVILD